jgi:serine/threonine protein kinase
LKGRYVIERELGRGGVGVVFLARDERLHGMPVVIKFLLDAAEQNKWLLGKFSQEAEALTRINHPGVVRVIDRDLADDGRPFFVMEFIKGRPLRDTISSGRPEGSERPERMDLASIARLTRQIGNALHAAHQQGVFHRDLKPENIMIEQLSGDEQQIKLIDFGIAKVVNPQAGNETEVAVVAGSRQYIAPEQLLSQMASPATDIYAMAIIVYEMVTGRLPFNPQGPTHFLVMQELMRLQQSESFARPRTLRPDLPAAAETLLINALSFDARRRPQNARVFAEDLAQALVGNIKVAGERPTIAVPAPNRDSNEPSAQKIAADWSRETAPMTRIKTEENVATVTDADSRDRRGAARPSSPTLSQNEPTAAAASHTNATQPKKSKLPFVIVWIIVVLIATGIAVKTLRRSGAYDALPTAAMSPTPQLIEPTASPIATAEPGSVQPLDLDASRSINYSVTLRKDPKRYPDSAPFQIPGEVIFSPGDRVHFSFISPQHGYLYLINESPAAKGRPASFNILFPSPTANDGSSILAAGKTIRIPEHDIGFVFDEEQGAEKLWLIWTANEVAALETLKYWANPHDVGEIKDAAHVEGLRAFLAAHSAEPQVVRDETSKQTMVTMKGDVLVKRVNLQHY